MRKDKDPENKPTQKLESQKEAEMTKELATKPTQEMTDGFDYDDSTEGEDERVSNSVIIGEKIKFTEKQIWVDRNGNPLSPLELVVWKIKRVIQYWKDGKPIEEHTHFLEDHEQWPDLKARNAKCPQSEWRKDSQGKMQGPWGAQRLVYFWDLRTAAKYTWPSPKDTIGSRKCVEELRDRINTMRKLRGEDVYAEIKLSDTYMPTRHSKDGRQRPHLPVKRFVRFGPNGVETVGEQLALPKGVQEVPPLTAKEITGDEVRY